MPNLKLKSWTNSSSAVYTLSSQYCYERTFDAKVGPVKNLSVYFYYTKIVRRQKMNAQAFSLHADALQILQRKAMLLHF